VEPERGGVCTADDAGKIVRECQAPQDRISRPAMPLHGADTKSYHLTDLTDLTDLTGLLHRPCCTPAVASNKCSRRNKGERNKAPQDRNRRRQGLRLSGVRAMAADGLITIKSAFGPEVFAGGAFEAKKAPEYTTSGGRRPVRAAAWGRSRCSRRSGARLPSILSAAT
jgi:hypothetical protein